MYEKRTHQIKVDIDGQEYIIRQSEDDNGCEYYVFHKDFDGWTSPYELEDGELKDIITKLADVAHDDYLFSTNEEGNEIDMDELNDY